MTDMCVGCNNLSEDGQSCKAGKYFGRKVAKDSECELYSQIHNDGSSLFKSGRDPEPRSMTLEDIQTELGYKITLKD